MAPPRVLVLYNEPVLPAGHPSAGSEQDVVDTADIITANLREADYLVSQLGVKHDPDVLLTGLRAERPNVVFNLFEGLPDRVSGEGTVEATVAGLLEWLGVPFTGSPAAAIALARHKGRTKHLLRGAGLPTPAFLVAERLPCPAWTLPWPAIVKPACQDASVGIEQASVVTGSEQLERRVAQVLERYGPPALVEQFVRGREFHVHVFEDPVASAENRLRLLPLAEIEFRDKDPAYWPIFGYEAKWDPNSRGFRAAVRKAPAALEPEREERLGQIARQAYRLVGCRDYARIDVRMTPDGDFYILEINPNPALSGNALGLSLAAADRTLGGLTVDIVRNALARAQGPSLVLAGAAGTGNGQ
jgi:D-alanine-D-alanine ligase